MAEEIHPLPLHQPTDEDSSISPENEWGWYLYGITRNAHTEDPRLATVQGIDGRTPIQILPRKDVAAVVSQVPLAELGIDVIRRRLKDEEWLESVVRGHERVVEEIHRQRTVLPVKFGCVYPSQQEVLAALESTHDTLLNQLETLAGCDEWGVRFYADQAVFERQAADSPSVRQVQAEIQAARPGRAYFIKRKLTDVLAVATEDAMNDLARTGYNHLIRLAIAGQITTDPRATSAYPEAEILHAAFLVQRATLDAFLEGISGFAEEQEGLRREYSGPWPPYSFVSLDAGTPR